jgi:6-pyruvoyltetrahydropterin/6-carboxytetrahydropterin synthase
MITITRRLTFAAGHRVLNHESKCANMHGHNYVAEITAVAEELDSLGRVVDFGVLKDRIGAWIDKNWDHGFIFMAADEEVIGAMRKVQGQKAFAMRDSPTAENMAKYLLGQANVLLELTRKEGYATLLATHVRLWETENCWADVHLDRNPVDIEREGSNI